MYQTAAHAREEHSPAVENNRESLDGRAPLIDSGHNESGQSRAHSHSKIHPETPVAAEALVIGSAGGKVFLKTNFELEAEEAWTENDALNKLKGVLAQRKPYKFILVDLDELPLDLPAFEAKIADVPGMELETMPRIFASLSPANEE